MQIDPGNTSIREKLSQLKWYVHFVIQQFKFMNITESTKSISPAERWLVIKIVDQTVQATSGKAAASFNETPDGTGGWYGLPGLQLSIWTHVCQRRWWCQSNQDQGICRLKKTPTELCLPSWLLLLPLWSTLDLLGLLGPPPLVAPGLRGRHVMLSLLPSWFCSFSFCLENLIKWKLFFLGFSSTHEMTKCITSPSKWTKKVFGMYIVLKN